MIVTLRLKSVRFRQTERAAKRYFKKNGKFQREVLKEFKRVTPRGDSTLTSRGGNAKRNTKLVSKGRFDFEVTGDYDYSGVIDEGLYPKTPKTGNKTRNGYSKKNLRLASPNKGLIDPTSKHATKLFKRFILSRRFINKFKRFK